MTPCGAEQTLSLAWALQSVGGCSQAEAFSAVREMFGFRDEVWPGVLNEWSWFIGDERFHRRSREKIQETWNQRFAALTGVSLDEESWLLPLWTQWLKTPKMIFAANLEYLIASRGRGAVAGLARAVGRRTETASKWAKWKEQGKKVRVPPSTAVPNILDFFGLPATFDLYAEPIFLGRDEIRDAVNRSRGKHYLDNMSGRNLAQAVERLGEESARQAAKKLGYKE